MTATKHKYEPNSSAFLKRGTSYLQVKVIAKYDYKDARRVRDLNGSDHIVTPDDLVPENFKDDFVAEYLKLKERNLTNKEIAYQMDIDESTLYRRIRNWS